MARVTVEDCISVVNNRFKLILLAAQRAKELEMGAQPSVLRDNDKSTVIALREIAENALNLETVERNAKQNLINNSNKYTGADWSESDLEDVDSHTSSYNEDNSEEEDSSEDEIETDNSEEMYDENEQEDTEDIVSTLDINELKNL